MNTPNEGCPPQTASRRRAWLAPTLLAGGVALLLAAGIVPRLRAGTVLARQVTAQNAVDVSVVTPHPAPAEQALLLPGSVMPYADAAIYARTSGFVDRWYADIGARVKAGQLLAVIRTPELDAQLRQAVADLASAQAALDLAKVTAQRWQEMVQTHSVSRQDADTKQADLATRGALLASARANVARLQELVSYEQVKAPFDGVITARRVDVGALVTASGTPGVAGAQGELFHIQQTQTLRVFVDVPQSAAAAVTPQTPAYLTVQDYPGRRFAARVARTTDSLDPATRTLRAEVDVDNADGTLLPGAFAEAHLMLRSAMPALQLPVSALLFRPAGVIVAIAGSDNKVALRSVTLGRDFGTYVEVVAGISGTDRVINNPGDAIGAGEAVHVVAAGATDTATPAAMPPAKAAAVAAARRQGPGRAP
ncbi:efflux RND transporter periplasmic adaptor subunit [Cupriavidus sp. 2TAF22]|uniref:efflux RND transporter periplasmic adaptor subunit n=1 Tax=unclassified Cupriavidus TaxID=2640874 RepID=UPI003F93283B